MALPENHMRHSPKWRLKQHIPQINETDPVFSTSTSISTPSIFELEHYIPEPSQKYIADTLPIPHSITHHTKCASPKKSDHREFLPQTERRWECRKRTTVFVTVTVLKLGEIQTIKEYFEADIYIQARWREPLLDNSKTTEIYAAEFWNPEIVLQNVFQDPKMQIWHEVRHTEKGLAYIYEMRRVKGKFYETMELNEFPFDVQGISMVISSELTKDVLDIVEDEEEISSIYVDCFSDSQEWDLYNFVEIDPLEISSQYTRARINYPGVTVTCCVSRKPGFFAWTILVIVNLLSIFAFTTFAVDPKLTQNRLQLSFVLMLAAISFRFVTNQSIPKIPYLTHLDRYVLVLMMFSGFITFWHAFLSRFKNDIQSSMDLFAFFVFAIFYLIFQSVFILVMFYQRQKKMNELRYKEHKYKFKSQNVAGERWRKIETEVAAGTASAFGLRNKPNVHTRPR